MSYYDTIDDDIKRAKEILAKGEGSGCAAYRPDHNGECQTCDEPADAHGDVSSAIMGADIYAAYKLLESFVAEIERLRGSLQKVLRVLGPELPDVDYSDAGNRAGLLDEVAEALQLLRAAVK
jgi:hypothetical protein